MSGRVTISRKAAESLLRMTGYAVNDFPASDEARAVEELRKALTPKPKSSAVKKTERKRREKQAETRIIYEQVAERAGGKCEACDYEFTGANGPELDHFRSRKHGQSVEGCWMLCALCHHAKTNNRPSANYWHSAFFQHCTTYGYALEAARVDARLAGIVSMREGSR